MKLTATLALLLLATSVSLVVAKPNRERRAPTSNIPESWGTKTIAGHSVPFGQWERSTQCTHLEKMQSAIELDWGSDNLPQGSSVTIDIVARPGDTDTFPRETTSFYLWAQSKENEKEKVQSLASSEGSGTCPSHWYPSKCLKEKKGSYISSLSIPSNITRFAILPVRGNCQHTYYRLRAQIPGTCGNDEFRVPVTTDGAKLVQEKDAAAACTNVNGGRTVLANANLHNLEAISGVAFDCAPNNANGDKNALVATWKGKTLKSDAIQLFLGDDRTDAPSVGVPNGDPAVPVCATVREEVFGQESSSHVRVVTHNQGMLRGEALDLCLDSKRGYGQIYSPWNKDFTSVEEGPDYKEALASIMAATGRKGAAWIQTPDHPDFKDTCLSLEIDEVNSFSGSPDKEPVIKAKVVREACDHTKLTAVVCVKSKDSEVVRMLRSVV